MKDIDVVEEALLDASPAEVFGALLDEAAGRSQWWRPALEIDPRPGTPAGQPGAILEVHVRSRRPVSFTERFAEVVDAPAGALVHTNELAKWVSRQRRAAGPDSSPCWC